MKQKRFDIWIALDDLIQSVTAPKQSEPEQIEDYTRPIRVEVSETAPNYDTQAETERAEALKAEYVAISEAIDMELSDLEDEYHSATASRRSAISKRRLTLYTKRASNTEKIQRIDRKLDRIYSEMH